MINFFAKHIHDDLIFPLILLIIVATLYYLVHFKWYETVEFLSKFFNHDEPPQKTGDKKDES